VRSRLYTRLPARPCLPLLLSIEARSFPGFRRKPDAGTSASRSPPGATGSATG